MLINGSLFMMAPKECDAGNLAGRKLDEEIEHLFEDE
jgi:hypothetical protein